MTKNIIIILFLFSSVLIIAQTNLSNKYRLGKTYEQSGKLERAKEIFKELALIQPTNNQFSNSLNDVYLKLKEYENSITFLNRRIKLRPNDVSLYGMLGATYYISGNSNKAIETWDKGILVNNNSQINYTIISNSAIQNRAFEIAIKYLEDGKIKSKNPTQLSYQLAQIYSHTMDYKNAASEYVEALKAQPSQLNYIKRRMEIYLSAVGASEESIEIVEKESESNVVKELLSFLYIKSNHYDKAFELEKKLDELVKNDGIRIYNFATESYNNSEFNVASQAYNFILENHPNSRFTPNCKVGFARTLEAELDEEWAKTHDYWKPISGVDTSGAFKYNTIIETYESILTFVNGELANESLFRIGKIYLNKFSDLEKSKKCFKKILANSSLSKYYGKANLEIAKIMLQLNKLDIAKLHLENVFSSSQVEKKTKEDAKFLIAQIQFYQSNFEGSLLTIANINKDLSSDLSNDAIQLEMIINLGKKDSLNLVKYATAELFALQLNFIQAEKEFQELSENKNLFFLNNISRLKYSEILLAQNKYPIAIEVLKELSETKELNIFADGSFYLLAQVYEFGILDTESAISTYERFLAKFPNSLHLEKAQKNLKQLKNKRSENL